MSARRMLVCCQFPSRAILRWELTRRWALQVAPGCDRGFRARASRLTARVALPPPARVRNVSVYVVDLGADAIHIFTISPLRSGANALTAAKSVSVPAGTGPRHLVTLPHDTIAFTGELGSTVILPGNSTAILRTGARRRAPRTRAPSRSSPPQLPGDHRSDRPTDNWSMWRIAATTRSQPSALAKRHRNWSVNELEVCDGRSTFSSPTTNFSSRGATART